MSNTLDKFETLEAYEVSTTVITFDLEICFYLADSIRQLAQLIYPLKGEHHFTLHLKEKNVTFLVLDDTFVPHTCSSLEMMGISDDPDEFLIQIKSYELLEFVALLKKFDFLQVTLPSDSYKKYNGVKGLINTITHIDYSKLITVLVEANLVVTNPSTNVLATDERTFMLTQQAIDKLRLMDYGRPGSDHTNIPSEFVEVDILGSENNFYPELEGMLTDLGEYVVTKT